MRCLQLILVSLFQEKVAIKNVENDYDHTYQPKRLTIAMPIFFNINFNDFKLEGSLLVLIDPYRSLGLIL